MMNGPVDFGQPFFDHVLDTSVGGDAGHLQCEIQSRRLPGGPMTDVTDDAAAAGVYERMAMGAMLDLAAPQERYLDLIAAGGFVEPMPGMALSFSRATTEYV